MTQLLIGKDGEVALPDTTRARYGMEPNTRVRLVETDAGVMLVALSDAPMDPALAREIAEWQALGCESLELFPYEDNGE